MKLLTTMLIAAALATGSGLAMAQPDHDHDQDRHGHHDDHGWHDRDHDHYDHRGDDHRGDDRHYDHRDDHRYYDHRVVVRHGPPHYYGPHYRHWERGYRYEGPVYVVHDYGYYRLRPPPRGYHWVRADDGQYLLVAIATGIILDIALH